MLKVASHAASCIVSFRNECKRVRQESVCRHFPIENKYYDKVVIVMVCHGTII